MTLAKYRLIDLAILTAVTCAMEAVSITLVVRLNVYFVVSLSAAMLLIITVRWNGWAFIPAVICGVFAPIMMKTVGGGEGAIYDDLSAYVAANCLLVALELGYFKILGKERATAGNWFLVVYAFIGYAAVCLGRSAVEAAFGDVFVYALIDNVKVEALNLVVAIIILFITNRQENMLCDQKEYFLQVRSGGNNEN